jgi:predicted negative regulator of RcsB-dependent stress response
MNIANYPTSFNVYDSMGDFEAANGNKAKAAEYYKKALTIKQFPDTRKKLNALLKK